MNSATSLATFLFAVRFVSLSTCTAFSSTPDIRIVGQDGGQPQMLPGSYVKTFTRWWIEKDDGDDGDDGDLQLERCKTDGDDSFVNPTSCSELWWPNDLRCLQVRPCLDVLMKGGSPSYALAGLTCRVPAFESGDEKEWRNYGLNSQPLAGQWTSFSFVVEGGFRVECFVGEYEDDESTSSPNKATEADTEIADETILWNRIFPGNLGALNDRPSAHAMFASQRMDEALETVGVFLSGIDESSPLSDGFHLVSFPLTEQWIDLPKLKSEKGYKVTCVATAEPDAEQLLQIDEGLVALTATSVLSVDVLPTASGSDSEYLPSSYRPLYEKYV